MYEVFISYSTKDIVPAEKIRNILEQNDISCWMAPRDIPGGSNYAGEIPRAIRGCKVFLLVMSENAQESKWVVKELDNAVNCGKIIIPLMLEDCPLNDEFNFLLTGAQRYMAYRKSEETLKTLIEQIKAIVGTKPVETVQEIQEEESENREMEAVSHKTDAVPVIRKAKPQKLRIKKKRAPFTFGKTEALALLAVPVMAALSAIGFLLGNCAYWYDGYKVFSSSMTSVETGNLVYYIIIGAVMGILMWFEWVRFRHREQMNNPETTVCPSCGGSEIRTIVFRTRRIMGREKLMLILVPVCIAIGIAAQYGIIELRVDFKKYYFANLAERFMLEFICSGALQGLGAGLWASNLLVRYQRVKSGLRSTVCRCKRCRATFLPVKK